MTEENDEVLVQLKDAVSPIMDKIEADVEGPRAALVIFGKELIVDGEYSGIQTFVDCTGDLGTIGEALYNELTSQIDENNPRLFNLLREVVKTIEQEKDIPDDEALAESRTLH